MVAPPRPDPGRFFDSSKVYDCFYLALAIQGQYPVITADRRLHDKVYNHPYLSDLIMHAAQMTGANFTKSPRGTHSPDVKADTRRPLNWNASNRADRRRRSTGSSNTR